jgi:hypothetical protein
MIPADHRNSDAASLTLNRQDSAATVNRSLTVAAESRMHGGVAAEGQSRAHGATDLTRGGGSTLVRGLGWLLACPRLPNEGRREGSLVKSAAAWATSPAFSGPAPLPFAPAGRVPEAGRAGASAGARPSRSVPAARAALGAALTPRSMTG